MSTQFKQIRFAILTILATLLLCMGTALAATKGIVIKDKVNLRKEPSKDAQILEVLKEGDAVSIRSSKGEWYYVDFGKQKGYIRKDLVKAQEEKKVLQTKTNAQPVQVQKASGKIYIRKDKVNLRNEPTTDGKVIVVLKYGQSVERMEIHGDWYKVRADNGTGFVRSDLCSVSKPKVIEPAETNEDSKEETNEETLVEGIDAEEESDIEPGIVVASDGISITDTDTVDDSKSAADPKLDPSTIQKHLYDLGFLRAQPDGKFGTVSLAALKSFQRAYGIKIDGQIGSETATALTEAVVAGGNGSSAGQVLVSSNGVILAEWFNFMKYNFPKYESLRVVDVATGETFDLRAFSLGNHADVEPPTQEDTDILYRINGNKWTWTPRPIWVYIGDKIYAAAINVQPHGPDTLPNNGMKGQICMHFLHSRQHNTGQENKNLQEALLESFAKASKAPAVGSESTQTASEDSNAA